MTLDKSDLKAIMFQLLDSVLAVRSAAYIAGPMNTGQLYYESMAQRGLSLNEVRYINQQRMTQFVLQLRDRLPYPVIHPGLMKISGWSRDDYAKFFLEVLEHYVKEVWYINGWEFSIGAVKEFVFCFIKGIPCFNEAGNEIDIEEGKLLILKAASYIDELGFESSQLRTQVNSLP